MFSVFTEDLLQTEDAKSWCILRYQVNFPPEGKPNTQPSPILQKATAKHKLPSNNTCPHLCHLHPTATSKVTWYPDKRPAVLRPDP